MGYKEKCNCQLTFVSSLKAKIMNDMATEDDVIDDSDQTSISELVEERFKDFNIIPPDISESPNLEQITDPEARNILKELIAKHSEVFSKTKYDTATFSGFVADLQVKPGTSEIQKE